MVYSNIHIHYKMCKYLCQSTTLIVEVFFLFTDEFVCIAHTKYAQQRTRKWEYIWNPVGRQLHITRVWMIILDSTEFHLIVSYAIMKIASSSFVGTMCKINEHADFQFKRALNVPLLLFAVVVVIAAATVTHQQNHNQPSERNRRKKKSSTHEICEMSD